MRDQLKLTPHRKALNSVRDEHNRATNGNLNSLIMVVYVKGLNYCDIIKQDKHIVT